MSEHNAINWTIVIPLRDAETVVTGNAKSCVISFATQKAKHKAAKMGLDDPVQRAPSDFPIAIFQARALDWSAWTGRGRDWGAEPAWQQHGAAESFSFPFAKNLEKPELQAEGTTSPNNSSYLLTDFPPGVVMIPACVHSGWLRVCVLTPRKYEQQIQTVSFRCVATRSPFRLWLCDSCWEMQQNTQAIAKNTQRTSRAQSCLGTKNWFWSLLRSWKETTTLFNLDFCVAFWPCSRMLPPSESGATTKFSSNEVVEMITNPRTPAWIASCTTSWFNSLRTGQEFWNNFCCKQWAAERLFCCQTSWKRCAACCQDGNSLISGKLFAANTCNVDALRKCHLHSLFTFAFRIELVAVVRLRVSHSGTMFAVKTPRTMHLHDANLPQFSFFLKCDVW